MQSEIENILYFCLYNQGRKVDVYVTKIFQSSL